MALKMNIESSTGILVENAYVKIDEYSCDKYNRIDAVIRGYVSKELEQDGSSPIEGTNDVITVIGDYSDKAPNPKKQIYENMKLMNKYKNAIDVLE